MNTFDLVVYVGVALAAAIGFRAGLLRSVMTILGYFLAMPIAIWITGLIAPQVGANAGVATQNSLLFFGVFVVAGIVLGAVLRMMVDDMTGSDIGLGDRLAGALLGAVRVGLIAVTMVLIFDQLLPAHLQPAWITQSRLRPYLSQAGQRGLQSLPPEMMATIEKWKRERRL